MTGHIVEAEAHAHGKAAVQGIGAVVRGAETWQFFAFVFAAVVTLALALLDEMPDRLWGWRVGAKVAAFVVLAYLLLYNVTVRRRLVILLGAFKEDRA